MANRIIKLKDRMKINDLTTGFRGEVIFGRGRNEIPFIDPYGNKSYRTEFDEVLYKAHNIVPIGGYQFAFSKLFNIALDTESTLRVGDLNDEAPQMKIGVPRSEYKSIHYNAETSITESGMAANSGVNISALNYVFGFMVGDGGAREDNITAIAPDYKTRNLNRAIPFRMSNDEFPMPEGKYFGKYESAPGGNGNTITSYYVKKFDNPAPRIVHCWVTDNTDELEIVDDTVFASTSSIPIESYVEMNISINKYDCRAFFTSTGATPRINEIGLVSGWYNVEKNDYECLRLMTKFSRPSILLDQDDSIEAIYRLYAR